MNQVLLRHSLCDNPELMERITLYATGLGDTKKDCTVVSPTANAGNGNVICDADVQAGMEELHRKEPAYSYAVRGDDLKQHEQRLPSCHQIFYNSLQTRPALCSKQSLAPDPFMLPQTPAM
jgi:hypothetical protein